MNTEQINALFDEWERPQGLTYKAGVTEVAKDFAAYCLSKQDDPEARKKQFNDSMQRFYENPFARVKPQPLRQTQRY